MLNIGIYYIIKCNDLVTRVQQIAHKNIDINLRFHLLYEQLVA